MNKATKKIILYIFIFFVVVISGLLLFILFLIKFYSPGDMDLDLTKIDRTIDNKNNELDKI